MQSELMQSDLRRAIPGERVFATIRTRHADRLKARRALSGGSTGQKQD
jgi:hypothetical protein